MTSEADRLVLRLGPGHAGAQTLNLRVSPAHRKELEELLDEHGVRRSDVLEFSRPTEPLWVYALSVTGGLGGLGGLAAALSAFLHRHRYREFKANLLDGTIEVKGTSVPDMERLLGDVLLANQDLERRMREQLGRPTKPAPEDV